MQQSITTNTLFYDDNLAIMREYIPDESVDLDYLRIEYLWHALIMPLTNRNGIRGARVSATVHHH